MAHPAEEETGKSLGHHSAKFENSFHETHTESVPLEVCCTRNKEETVPSIDESHEKVVVNDRA